VWFLNLCYLLVHLSFLQADSTADFYGYVGVFVLLPADSATAREVEPISSEFEIRYVQYVQLLSYETF
jgi:hypothetical protein